MIVECIRKVSEGKTLDEDDVRECINEIVSGKATESQMGALLASMHTRGERAEEIASFAKVLASMAVRVIPGVSGRIVDTCGTGGDGVMTFNISTVSAFVAAGAGCIIAKHGNRSFTSKCGSADLLEALGYNLNSGPDLVKTSIEKIGIGFIFAPLFHPALKSVSNVRKEIGIRTIFNLIGPLLNPAGAKAQLLGVYDLHLIDIISSALSRLGIEEAFVVHGMDGTDEISVCDATIVNHVNDGRIERKECIPSDFGIQRHSLRELIVKSKEEAVKSALSVLKGEDKSGKMDAVLVNAAAAIVLSKKASNFLEAMEIARESISSGKALQKLIELIKLSGKEVILDKLS